MRHVETLTLTWLLNLACSGNDVIILQGVAGSGRSACTLRTACPTEPRAVPRVVHCAAALLPRTSDADPLSPGDPPNFNCCSRRVTGQPHSHS